MPLPRYGVLVAQAIDRVREGSTATTPHYQVRVREPDGTDHRIAINVLSNKAPSELLYLVNDDFRHPITDTIGPLTPGWHPLESRPGTGSLDFIRGNLLDPGAMRTLPHDASGPDNDLADIFDHYVGRAIADPAARLYAFGQRWGPEPSATDQVFGFLPGNGVHDIHMNQGNVPDYSADDGVWQDGALLLHFPAEDRWVGVFLAFQSQAWHTDDVTGHAIGGGPTPQFEQAVIRVLAARVNPVGVPEDEAVLLINASPNDVDLAGWLISDKSKATCPIPAGVVAAGETLLVHLTGRVALGNRGGQITVLDAAGLKVHGVSYTADDARREGWTVTF